MKCPHCSYVSFEYLDTCRKCSKDLTAHKSKFGIDFIEPIAIGVLAHISQADVMESTSITEVDVATATAFDTDDFSVGGDTSDTETAEVGGISLDEIEIDSAPPPIPEEPEPVVEEEAPEISLDITEFEVEEASDEEAEEISLDFGDQEEADKEEIAPQEEISLDADDSLSFDEPEETVTIEEESLDLGALEDGALETIEGPIDPPTENEAILDSSLEATSSDFSLGLGEDFETDTELNLDTLDDDMALDVSLEDDTSADILFAEEELDDKPEIQTPDLEPAEDMDIDLDDALDIDLDDLELGGEKSDNDETITEALDDTSLDLQIGDDDLDLDMDIELDMEQK
ncbi:hypothetical protein MNBD_NITROSPINAE01-291 [hydrothermal vent metagenome]|uniref:Uncharacterized protein n=1 Tax=hydrothermal vent metagenome TaxID=652676 RepID=A0A3B1C0F7_9ZZZZ